MERVVGANKKIGIDFREFFGGGQHKLAHATPVAAVDASHIISERVSMHRYFRMRVRAEKVGTFHANGPIAERRPFGGGADDPNVLWHDGLAPRLRRAAYFSMSRSAMRRCPPRPVIVSAAASASSTASCVASAAAWNSRSLRASASTRCSRR